MSGHEGHMDHGSMDHSMTTGPSMDHSMHTMDHSKHNMDDHSMHGDNMSMDMHHMGMAMFFTTDFSDLYVLFEGWHIDNVAKLIGSFIGIFIMATLYEGLKYFREYLLRKTAATMFGQPAMTGVANNASGVHTQKYYKAMISKPHLIQTVLHMIQVLISYFIMLIFMTYNVWLCLAVILGSGLGYFLFGWNKTIVVDITEHCH